MINKPINVPDSEPLQYRNKPDEWKIEQGLSGGKLPFLDQTGSTTVEILPRQYVKTNKDTAAIEAVGKPNELFKREREGWKGCVVLQPDRSIL